MTSPTTITRRILFLGVCALVAVASLIATCMDAEGPPLPPHPDSGLTGLGPSGSVKEQDVEGTLVGVVTAASIGVGDARVILNSPVVSIASTRTDAIGRYSFSGIPAGEYTLKATHDIFGSAVGSVLVSEEKAATADLTFMPRASVSGVIHAASELRSVFVHGVAAGGLHQEEVFRKGQIVKRDDDEVHFVVDALWPGTYTAVATAGALAVAESCSLSRNGVSQAVILDLAAAESHGHTTQIQGRVFLDGVPLVEDAFKLRATWPASEEGEAMTVQCRLTTDADGRYGISIATLEMGTRLEFGKTGTNVCTKIVETFSRTQETEVHLLSLKSNGTIRLLDEKGRGLEGARLFGGAEWNHGSVVTDSNGVARFFDVPPGDVTVTAKFPIVSDRGTLFEGFCVTRTSLANNPHWHIGYVGSLCRLRVTHNGELWARPAHLYCSDALHGACDLAAGITTLAWQGSLTRNSTFAVRGVGAAGETLWGSTSVVEGQTEIHIELHKPVLGQYRVTDETGSPVRALILWRGRDRHQRTRIGSRRKPPDWRRILGSTLVKPQDPADGRYLLGEIVELGVDWSEWWLMAPGIGALSMNLMSWDEETIAIPAVNSVAGRIVGAKASHATNVSLKIGDKTVWGLLLGKEFVVPLHPGERPSSITFEGGGGKWVFEEIQVGVAATLTLE